MSTWNELHDNPRISYYLFLRHEQGLSARDAHARVKRTDAMVAGLQGDRRRSPNRLSLKFVELFCYAERMLGRAHAQTVGLRHGNWGKRWSDTRPSLS